MNPLISVVVPCRNEVGYIRKCIESILGQVPIRGGFEIIIADGMSDDGTREILADMVLKHPQLRVVDNPRQITPCGMNAGIREARGNWIVIMGSHNRYAPDYLARCLEVANETAADNVGGAMRCEGRELVQRAIAAAHHSPFAVGGSAWHNPEYEGPADTVFGGFYRRDIFDRIGIFDETLVRNQDDELNLRLTRAGGRIWHSPRIRSWYSPRKSLWDLFLQYFQYGYWKVRVIQKHRVPASWRHLVPGVFVLILFWFLMLYIFTTLASLYSLILNSSFLLLFLAYASVVMAASFHTAARTEWKLISILPMVFPCYHFGYGLGFLRGTWDFIIWKKRPPGCSGSLTR